MEKMHKKIKEVTGKKRSARTNIIKTKEGEIAMDIEDVCGTRTEKRENGATLLDKNSGRKKI